MEIILNNAIIDHELIRPETYSREDKCLIGAVGLTGAGLIIAEVAEAATGNIDMMPKTFGIGGLCLIAVGTVVGLIHHFRKDRTSQ